MKMSNRTPVLTKKDLRRCALRSWINVNLFNYETQLGGAVVFAEAKALRKIYPDDDDYRKAMLNQFKYYNTMPYFHGLLLGAGLAMEDKDGLEALDAVQSLKVGLMGPLAGVGDPLGWILLPTIFGSIAGYMGTQGNPIGLIIWCVLYVMFYIWRLSWWNYGYKLGASFISAIGSKLNAFTESASILGLFVVGAMIPSVVTMTTGLNFNYGDVSMNIQTDILDAILPCMLPLALTVVIYRLLKKGVKLTYIILGLLVIGCIGAATGLLV